MLELSILLNSPITLPEIAYQLQSLRFFLLPKYFIEINMNIP